MQSRFGTPSGQDADVGLPSQKNREEAWTIMLLKASSWLDARMPKCGFGGFGVPVV